MPAEDCTEPSPAHPHPMANPGYGKRAAPAQLPRKSDDFAHLPAREASVAAYLDRLPEGAAMDHKTLAKHLPRIGQAACRTVLNNLTDAGHLRRFRERVTTAVGEQRCVTRTFFSRTARDDAWWTEFRETHGFEPEPEAASSEREHENRTRQPAPEEPVRQQPAARAPSRSRAYAVLAELGRRDPRLALSARECEALEKLAATWLDRDPDAARFYAVLTAGLPPEVGSPHAFTAKRLETKMPPEPAPESRHGERVVERIMLCFDCERPGTPAGLPGGLCPECREESGLPPAPRPRVPDTFVPAARVHDHAAGIRAALRENTA